MTGLSAPVQAHPTDELGPGWFTCALPTSCQPPVAFGDRQPWPATLTSVSQRGLRLALGRRFERGTGLAIELPDGQGTSTALARVQQLSPAPAGGWQLVCQLISPLSEEEIFTLLEIDQLRSRSVPGPLPRGAGRGPASGEVVVDEGEKLAETPLAPTQILEPSPNEGVLFQAKLPSGEVVRWVVRRLDLPGAWPLEKDRLIALRLPDSPAGTFPLEMVVKSCRLRHGVWVVNGRCGAAPAPEFLRAIGVSRQ